MNQLMTVLVAILMGAMLSPYIASAIDRQAAAEQTRNINYSALNKGYFDGFNDDYEVSNEREVAQHANEFIKNNRND